MCEIAIFRPLDRTVGEIMELSRDMFEHNDDGIGIILVKSNSEKFSFPRVMAHDKPDWPGIEEWLEDNYDRDSVWRVIIHARLGTCGGVGIDQAHPIKVDCDVCDVDLVVHNGVVSQSQMIMSRLEGAGHEFTTEVDSEAIAHAHGTVPESASEASVPDSLHGQLNYLVMNEDRIAMRSGGRYEVSFDFEAFKTSRLRDDFVPRDFDGEFDVEWLIAKPDFSIEVSRDESLSSFDSSGGRSYGYGTGFVHGSRVSGCSTSRAPDESAGVSGASGSMPRASNGNSGSCEVPPGGVSEDFVRESLGYLDNGYEVIVGEDGRAWCYDPVEQVIDREAEYDEVLELSSEEKVSEIKNVHSTDASERYDEYKSQYGNQKSDSSGDELGDVIDEFSMDSVARQSNKEEVDRGMALAELFGGGSNSSSSDDEYLSDKEFYEARERVYRMREMPLAGLRGPEVREFAYEWHEDGELPEVDESRFEEESDVTQRYDPELARIDFIGDMAIMLREGGKPSEAVDFFAVSLLGYDKQYWSKVRGVEEDEIHKNVVSMASLMDKETLDRIKEAR